MPTARHHLNRERDPATSGHGRQPSYRRAADAGLRPMSDHPPDDVTAGHRVYTSRFLSFYDLVVLRWFSNTAWRCPAAVVTSLYDTHVSANHLDVGVGTGYFGAADTRHKESPGQDHMERHVR